MSRLVCLSLIAAAVALAGCGEKLEPRSADWYSANPKERAADLQECRTTPPTNDTGKQNCKHAEMSEVRDLAGPSRVRIR
jgi:hypothetical protein